MSGSFLTSRVRLGSSVAGLETVELLLMPLSVGLSAQLDMLSPELREDLLGWEKSDNEVDRMSKKKPAAEAAGSLGRAAR